MSDIDPEGFYRHPDPLCVCGPLYTYGGHIEPGGYAEDCPIHGNPKVFYDEVERLRAGVQELYENWWSEWANERDSQAGLYDMDTIQAFRVDLRSLLDPTEGDNDE